MIVMNNQMKAFMFLCCKLTHLMEDNVDWKMI